MKSYWKMTEKDFDLYSFTEDVDGGVGRWPELERTEATEANRYLLGVLYDRHPVFRAWLQMLLTVLCAEGEASEDVTQWLAERVRRCV